MSASRYRRLDARHVVIGAINEIESLASGLSGKIWQKIMILDRVAED